MTEKARWRFTISTLLVLTAYAGLTFAVAANDSRLLLCVHYTVTVSVLLLAACGSFLSVGSVRRFWIGFAVFGWVFFLMSVVPPINSMGHHLPGWEVAASLQETYQAKQKPFDFDMLYPLCWATAAILAGLFGGMLIQWLFPYKWRRENENVRSG